MPRPIAIGFVALALAITGAACHPIQAGDSPATIIDKTFHDRAAEARAVAQCESSMDPTARSGPNYGLFQINSVHADQWQFVIGAPFYSSWMDPVANARFAEWLQSVEGWGPWACRP